MVKVEIDSIRVSLMSQDRVVVLKDVNSERYLPIWIGAFEAEAIRAELKNIQVSRPLTHDLLKSVITQLGANVERIVVNDLRHDIFYATIIMTKDGQTIEIDSRPSDAIALAVRLKVPIFVEDSVLETAAIEPEEAITSDSEVEDVDSLLAEEATDSDADEGLNIFKDFLDTLDMDDLADEE